MSNVLAVGAHPDDIELGCGGTIVKHLSLGHEVYALIITNGERGSHTFNKEECLNSLNKLGLKETNIFFGNFPDGYLINNLELVSFIENFINRFDVKKIYTHFHLDRHQDHSNLSKAVSAAARRIPEVLLFQGPSTNGVFEPHYYIELSKEQIDKKIDALSNYYSQRKKGIVDLDWVYSIAIVNGLKCNTKYAEAFTLNHVLRGGNDV